MEDYLKECLKNIRVWDNVENIYLPDHMLTSRCLHFHKPNGEFTIGQLMIDLTGKLMFLDCLENTLYLKVDRYEIHTKENTTN